MKPVRCLTVSLLVALLASAIASAQAPASGPASRPAGVAAGAREPGSQPAARDRSADGYALQMHQKPNIEETLKKITFTAEQQKQVAPLQTAYDQSLASFRKETEAEAKAARDALEAASASRDRAAVTAAREKIDAIEARRLALEEGFRKQVSAAMAPEQLAQFNRLLSPAGAFDRLAGDIRKLELTAEQKARVDELVKSAEGGAKDKTGKELADVYANAARGLVIPLTEVQRAKLREIRAQPSGRSVASAPASQPVAGIMKPVETQRSK